jgi:hypothetical protein
VGVICDKDPLFKDKMEIVFEDIGTMRHFITGLQILINEAYFQMVKGSFKTRKEAHLRNLWAEVDVNADGHLDL